MSEVVGTLTGALILVGFVGMAYAISLWLTRRKQNRQQH